MKPSSHCVHHAGRDVPVLVERKRVKNFNLHVRADASVFCSVPNAASSKQIDDFLTRHASWIVQHVVRAEQAARTQPRIVGRIEATMGIHAERWSLRTMKSRWGSCTPARKTIRINTQLAAYPPLCLEMVVTHELVHLMEPSHNARFHALLDTYCPSNREASRILRKSPLEAANMTRGAEPNCCSAPR